MGSLHIAPSSKPPQTEKSKTSFLARVTSRPSLSARYSSADLKSSVKQRHDIRAPETVRNDTALRPHHITHSVPTTRAQDVANDKVIYTSPRTAPSPPNIEPASSTAFSQSSLCPSDAHCPRLARSRLRASRIANQRGLCSLRLLHLPTQLPRLCFWFKSCSSSFHVDKHLSSS